MKDKETRRREADLRNATHKSLDYSQRILKLDMRFGKDLGAKKERAKLAERIKSMPVALPAYPLQENQQKKKPYQKPKRS